MKSESRDQILSAASKLFLEGGIHALSVRAIAKGAGMSTIGIYSHFNGKQGILDALYIDGFSKVTELMKTVKEATPKASVLEMCRQILVFSEDFAAHYKLIFGANMTEYSPSEEAFEAATQGFITLTKVTSSLLHKDANLREKQELAMEIWAITHGYIGLNNHEISHHIDWGNWKTRALNALETHVDAIIAKLQ